MNAASENRAVALLSEIIALERGYSPAEAGKIGTASALHDIGKLRIPTGILNKPGKLSAQEFEIVKTHTRHGAEMLKTIQGSLGELARNIALWHHEKWDARGYWGLFAGDLPEYTAIASLADVSIALLHQRPYKPAWPLQDVLDYIQSQAGKQFSPELTEVFFSVSRKNDLPALLYGIRKGSDLYERERPAS